MTHPDDKVVQLAQDLTSLEEDVDRLAARVQETAEGILVLYKDLQNRILHLEHVAKVLANHD